MICAICTADILGTVHREPIGRGDAMVAVCEGCASEHPRGGRYSFSESGCGSDRLNYDPLGLAGTGNRRTPNRSTGSR